MFYLLKVDFPFVYSIGINYLYMAIFIVILFDQSIKAMKIRSIKLIYFSATYTTQKVVRSLAGQFKLDVTEYDVTEKEPDKDIICAEDELLIVGMPVYSGRIPTGVPAMFGKVKGNGTPAIIVCVYGNRDYDDALLELKDVVEGSGFKVVAAGAFIARHSIFTHVAEERPDKKDEEAITGFYDRCASLLGSAADISVLPGIAVKGNRPYKIPGGAAPFHPAGDDKCIECGICAGKCPVDAIPVNMPRTTDGGKCIACGRCIVVCPTGARDFRGEMYEATAAKFTAAFSARKEPETFFAG